LRVEKKKNHLGPRLLGEVNLEYEECRWGGQGGGGDATSLERGVTQISSGLNGLHNIGRVCFN